MSQPEQNQIDDWQSQWNATKNMYQAEINFMNEVITSKTNELTEMSANVQEWANTPIEERMNLRLMVIQAQQQLQQILGELASAKAQFISVNPQSEHYVQF